MKPEQRNNWGGEDYEFQQEFQDVSESFQEFATDVPPADLDRQIKKLAYSQVAKELENHWLLGSIPQLSMAVSLMFAIGVLFVVSVDNDEADYPLVVSAEQAADGFQSNEQRRVKQRGNRFAEEERRLTPVEQLQTVTETESDAVESSAEISYSAFAVSAAQPARPLVPQTLPVPQTLRRSAQRIRSSAAPEKAKALTDDYHLLEEADPHYPRGALQQGLAGWVLLEFSISTVGEVLDPVVIDNCASTVAQNCAGHANPIFDEAALQAVRQYKYKPKYEGGQALQVEGVQHTVSFVLP